MTAPVPVTPTEARARIAEYLNAWDGLYGRDGGVHAVGVDDNDARLLHTSDLRALLAALPAEPAADARLAAAREEGRQEFLTRWGPDAESYAAMTARLAAVEALCEQWESRYRSDVVAISAVRAALSGAAPAPTKGPQRMWASGVLVSDEETLCARHGDEHEDDHTGWCGTCETFRAAPQPDGTEPTCPCGETGPRCAAPIDCGRRYQAPQPAGEACKHTVTVNLRCAACDAFVGLPRPTPTDDRTDR